MFGILHCLLGCAEISPLTRMLAHVQHQVVCVAEMPIAQLALPSPLLFQMVPEKCAEEILFELGEEEDLPRWNKHATSNSPGHRGQFSPVRKRGRLLTGA